jgi:hypothetical protein
MQKILLEIISPDKFNTIQFKIFEDILLNRVFGIIRYEKKEYGIAWQSDILSPVITEISDGIYSIGVDQNFAIVNFNIDKIEFNTTLTYNFCNSYIYKEDIYIISELEVIKMNVQTFEIQDCYALPDIFEEIFFENNHLEITCMNYEPKVIIPL